MTDVQTLLEDFGVEKFLEYVGAESITNINGSIRSTCPIHKGKNPTAFSYHDGKFTCFSDCDKTFSPIDVLMEVFHIPFPEAKNRLESLLGGTIEFSNNRTLSYESLDNKNFIKTINNLKKCTKEQSTIDLSDISKYKIMLHEYLQNEGFDNETRRYFDLRYCDIGRFRHRVIIPIDNKLGNIIGLSGRSVFDFRTLEKEHIPKYLFTTNFKKEETLYNISRADVYSDYMIVVEGYKSVWRLHSWGYDNAVAVMGATLSNTQKRLLIDFDLPILVAGDNDSAGEKLSRIVQKELKHFVPVEVFPIAKASKNKKDSIAEIKKGDFEYWSKKLMQKYPKKMLF